MDIIQLTSEPADYDEYSFRKSTMLWRSKSKIFLADIYGQWKQLI